MSSSHVKRRSSAGSAWRAAAVIHLPTLRQVVDETSAFAVFCARLRDTVCRIYAASADQTVPIAHTPEHEAQLRGIFHYAEWCLLQSDSVSLISDIALLFYEELGDDPRIVREFYRFVAPDALGVLRAHGTLAALVGKEQVEAFVQEYRSRRDNAARRP